MNNSIWKKDYEDFNFNTSIKNKTDILIIGAGITGITLAYYLKDSESDITLIDKSKVMMGVTSKTTAKITYLQGVIYGTLSKKFNKEVSKLYLDSQKDAINEIKKIIDENKIDCSMKKTPSIVFTNQKDNILKIDKELKILNEFGVDIIGIKNENIKYGIKVEDTYVFNPIKFLSSLLEIIKNKIDIFEHTIATNIRKENDLYIVKTNKGEIKAKKVVVCNHYPFFIFPSLIPLKTYIKREYVNAAKYENKNISAINIDKNLYSVRFYDDYIIYGSNSHKLTSKTDYQKNYIKSKEDFYKEFNMKPEYTWMNQDVISNDGLPFIGEIDDNLFISTAYNAWGMTNGVIGAKLISDLIFNKDSKYKELFNPKRLNFNLVFKSFIGSFSYAKAYVKSIFIKNNPRIIKIDKVLYGVYIDRNKKKHYIKLICPHMTCPLIFNNEEKTWDCPCHGSRFDLDGNLLEGPAKKNLIDKEN